MRKLVNYPPNLRIKVSKRGYQNGQNSIKVFRTLLRNIALLNQSTVLIKRDSPLGKEAKCELLYI